MDELQSEIYDLSMKLEGQGEKLVEYFQESAHGGFDEDAWTEAELRGIHKLLTDFHIYVENSD